MKNCKVCGKVFFPKKGSGKNVMYCGQKCRRHAQHYNKLDENRERNRKWYQENKQSEIEKNREYRKQNRELFNWYHNKERFNGLRTIVLEKDGFLCQICKGSDRISIHHIDGNGNKENANNEMDNLITLCKSCHPKLHWWQRKNKQLMTREDIVRTMTRVIEANSKS